MGFSRRDGSAIIETVANRVDHRKQAKTAPATAPTAQDKQTQPKKQTKNIQKPR